MNNIYRALTGGNYMAKRGGCWRVVRDGDEGTPYTAKDPDYNSYAEPAFSFLAFSPDSKHLSYLVTRHGKDLIDVDGREYPSDAESMKSFLQDIDTLRYPIIPSPIDASPTTQFLGSSKFVPMPAVPSRSYCPTTSACRLLLARVTQNKAVIPTAFQKGLSIT